MATEVVGANQGYQYGLVISINKQRYMLVKAV